MAARRAPKKSGIVADAPVGGTKSAVELLSSAPRRYWSAHFHFENRHRDTRDYADALNAGHRVFTLAGSEIANEAQFLGALKRDGQVWSNA